MPRLIHVTTVPRTLAFFSGQIGFMREQGFEVTVISSSGEDLDRFAEREKIRAYGVEMARQITPLRDAGTVWRLWRIFRRERPDIVHAHTPKAGLLAMIAARAAGAPVRIFHIHGLPHMTATGNRRRLLRWSSRVACALSNRVLAVSQGMRAVAIQEGFTSPEKSGVPANGSVNGVEASGKFHRASLAAGTREAVRAQYGIPEGAVVMGFVGRLVRDKGVIDLVNAWDRLRAEYPDVHWLIAGEEEPHDPLPEEISARLRDDPRIHPAGWRRDLEKIYAAMDFIVLPSYREGFPVVPLEAAAMELPVIAARVPGTVEAVRDGVSGVLVSPGNVDEIAGAVRTYIENSELRREHGRMARERVLQWFRPETIWRETADEYRRMLQASMPRRCARRAIKRGIDVIAALAGLAIFSPLYLAIAVSIRLTMGSPVLFRQIRPGWQERPIEVLKFRTMTDERGSQGELLPDSARLTKLGKFLRETSLDELPQLCNVLKGDLSLVGPRPLLVEYLPRYSAFQRRRHEAKPGMTGWAQIHGRNGLPWRERLACDVWYVDHWSLTLDLRILWRTAWAVFSRKGISEPGQATMSFFEGDR